MPATLERSVETETKTIEKTIEIPVTISLGEAGTFFYLIDDVTARGMDGIHWVIIWTLEPEPSSQISAHFREPWIVFNGKPSPLPSGVDDHLVTKISPTKLQLKFTSNVIDVNVIRYSLLIDAELLEAGNFRRRLMPSTDIVIDPTIAIVEDPIGG